jgi:hypothetical protein
MPGNDEIELIIGERQIVFVKVRAFERETGRRVLNVGVIHPEMFEASQAQMLRDSHLVAAPAAYIEHRTILRDHAKRSKQRLRRPTGDSPIHAVHGRGKYGRTNADASFGGETLWTKKAKLGQRA